LHMKIFNIDDMWYVKYGNKKNRGQLMEAYQISTEKITIPTRTRFSKSVWKAEVGQRHKLL